MLTTTCVTMKQCVHRVAGRLAAVVLLLAATSPAAAQEASFQGLGDLPGRDFYSTATGVSGDGSVVVGRSDSDSPSQWEAFRWTSGDGMVGLDSGFRSRANGVSDDGSAVVGGSGYRTYDSFRWTAEDGIVSLGDLPGGSVSSRASEVSADGSVVVGWGTSAEGHEAFRWENGVMIGLGDLLGGIYRSHASDVSADGSVVVGWGKSDAGTEAFRWEGGVMVGLGHLPGGRFHSDATAVSADGSVVVGSSDSNSGSSLQAYRWEGGVMVNLDDLPDNGWSSAWGVSADGSVVVGGAHPATGAGAMIWDDDNGMRMLQQVLEDDFGLDLTGWRLLIANNISANGLVIVGDGFNPSGDREAWRAVLGPANHGPSVTCPQGIAAECVDGGANILLTTEVSDADGDPLNVEWNITFPDGSTNIVTETVLADPSDPVAVGLVDPQVSPAGFVFPHGDSVVNVSVSDGISEIFSCSPIIITVEDTQAPVVMTLMEQIEVGTDLGECFATVDLSSESSPYTPVFADLCGENVTAEHNAPATFPLGETVVTWTVNDGAGNLLSVTQTVIVSDTEAPTATAPLDLVLGHDVGDCVATLVNLGLPDADDNCDEEVKITNNAPDMFPLGETEVEWLISDEASNTIILTQLVTVTNATPVASAGANQVLECNLPTGRLVTLDASATTDADTGDLLSFHWEAVDIAFDNADSPTPIAIFPRGSTTVQLTVTDQCGAESTAVVLVIIEDTTAPQIQAVLLDKSVLSPPNHKMVSITLNMFVSDECSSPGDLLLRCTVESDEPDDELGDGEFTGDVNSEDGYIAPVEIPLTYNANTGGWEADLNLRAERSGTGDGRKYSIRCAAADASGNITYATACVTVPHNQSGGKKK